jgi:hypothetical protein
MGSLPHSAAGSGAWGVCRTARTVQVHGVFAAQRGLLVHGVFAAPRGLFWCMGSLPHSAVRNPLGQDATRAKASKNMEPQMHTDAH